MGLFRLLMVLSLKTLILFYFLGTNSITVLADRTKTTKLHLTTTAHDSENTANPPSPPPPPPPQERASMAPFKPSIAIVVGVLTTLFSITFLLLLYAKHCKRENGNGYSNNSRGHGVPSVTDRKNSGVDRTVIESLPIFRFGSLRGAKDGLECAVCLNRFEPTEVLKLLPKCKHAFHVECVDTWLDAHSTCPLCRYRVDPEDILLLNDAVAKVIGQHEPLPPQPEEVAEVEILRRVSGRHSSAGERGKSNGGFLQIVVEKAGEENNGAENLTTRRSLDGWTPKLPEFLGQMTSKKKSKEAISVGCFDRRKDGMLLTLDEERTSLDRRRLEHRIIVGGGGGGGGGVGGFQYRWSDVQPSDLLYLRSEMIMSDSRGLLAASGSRPSVQDINRGRSVMNGRSVSEITGLSRLRNSYGGGNNRRQRRWEERGGGDREAGVVSRWLAWVSQSSRSSSSSHPSQTQTQQTLPAVRS